MTTNKLDTILEDHWNAALSCVAELNEENWTEEEYLKAQANYRKHDKQAIEAYIAERPSAEAFIKWGWGKRCKTTDKEDFPEIEHDPLANRCANCEMWEHFDEWKSQLKSNERVRKIDDQNYVYDGSNDENN